MAEPGCFASPFAFAGSDRGLTMTARCCPQCGEARPSEFYAHSRLCRRCERARRRARYRRNPDRERAYRQQYYRTHAAYRRRELARWKAHLIKSRARSAERSDNHA